MVAFDTVVGVLVGVVERVRQLLLDDGLERLRQVGHDLAGAAVGGDRPGEEPAGRRDVAASRNVHVDDLAVLVDGAVDVPPPADDLHVGLVDEEAGPDCVAARAGGVDEERREVLHPPEQRDVINLDASFGEELFEVPERQPEPQVPAHRQHDHLGREAEPGERAQINRWAGTSAAQPVSLAARGHCQRNSAG